MNKKLFVISKKSVFYSDEMFNALEDGIGSIREIEVNNAYDLFIDRYSTVVKTLRVLQAKARFLSTFPIFFIESLAIVFIVFLGYFLFINSNGIIHLYLL